LGDTLAADAGDVEPQPFIFKAPAVVPKIEYLINLARGSDSSRGQLISRSSGGGGESLGQYLATAPSLPWQCSKFLSIATEAAATMLLMLPGRESSSTRAFLTTI
jgi:hypothetical protein